MNQNTFPSLHRANRGNSPSSEINLLTEQPFHELCGEMCFHLFFNNLLIFERDGWQNWDGFDHAVEQVKQPRTHFDHFVLFLNIRIVQHVENDRFLINDVFTETNKRRGKDERY